jgi:hypothetical protein
MAGVVAFSKVMRPAASVTITQSPILESVTPRSLQTAEKLSAETES